jgi:hypothetical protein
LLLRQTVDFARPVGVNDGGISLSYQERLGETVADSTQKQTLMTDRQTLLPLVCAVHSSKARETAPPGAPPSPIFRAAILFGADVLAMRVKSI